MPERLVIKGEQLFVNGAIAFLGAVAIAINVADAAVAIAKRKKRLSIDDVAVSSTTGAGARVTRRR